MKNIIWGEWNEDHLRVRHPNMTKELAEEVFRSPMFEHLSTAPNGIRHTGRAVVRGTTYVLTYIETHYEFPSSYYIITCYPVHRGKYKVRE